MKNRFIQMMKVWRGIYRLYDEELSVNRLNYLMIFTNISYYKWKGEFLFDEELEVWASGLKYRRLYDWWKINEKIVFKFKYVWPGGDEEFLLFLKEVMYKYGFEDENIITIWGVSNSIFERFAPGSLKEFFERDKTIIITNENIKREIFK